MAGTVGTPEPTRAHRSPLWLSDAVATFRWTVGCNTDYWHERARHTSIRVRLRPSTRKIGLIPESRVDTVVQNQTRHVTGRKLAPGRELTAGRSCVGCLRDQGVAKASSRRHGDRRSHAIHLNRGAHGSDAGGPQNPGFRALHAGPGALPLPLVHLRAIEATIGARSSKTTEVMVHRSPHHACSAARRRR